MAYDLNQELHDLNGEEENFATVEESNNVTPLATQSSSLLHLGLINLPHLPSWMCDMWKNRKPKVGIKRVGKNTSFIKKQSYARSMFFLSDNSTHPSSSSHHHHLCASLSLSLASALPCPFVQRRRHPFFFHGLWLTSALEV